MEESLDYEVPGNTGLPVFLKVLCILTFVGAGFGFLSGVYSFFTIETSMKIMQTSPFSTFNSIGSVFDEYIFWGRIAAGAGMLGNGLCIAGALMMWKLKRIGFYIYCVGELLPLAFSIIFVSKQQEMMSGLTGPFSGLVWAGMAIGILFYAAFIIMYAVNLKHLKN